MTSSPVPTAVECASCGDPTTSTQLGHIGGKVGPFCEDCAHHCDGNLIQTVAFGSSTFRPEEVHIYGVKVGYVSGRDPQERYSMHLGESVSTYWFPTRIAAIEALASWFRTGSWTGEIS